MKGSSMWLNRRQVRWLIVLLALLPLLPAIVAMRFAIDNALRERDEAIAEETRIYREQLLHLVSRISANSPPPAEGEVLVEQLRSIFGEGSILQLHDPATGKVWTHGEDPSDENIQMVIQEGIYRDWTVILDRVVDLPDYIREARRNAWARASAWALGVALVAAIVWFAVHRGLQVDDLRSDLLTTVSHEMKTPLASMRILLETLVDDPDGLVLSDEKKRRDYLDLALRENRRLTRLAEDFLTFARLERGDLKLRKTVCNPDEIVDGVLGELAPAIEISRASVSCDWTGHQVVGDPEAISSIVRNLVENALKYGNGEDGFTEIHLSTEPSSVPDYTLLVVSDRGPGIPHEHQHAIFRRFFRIDDRLSGSGSGVGLGLAICRHLVRKMKGRIAWEPNPGGGSRFVVKLQTAVSADQPKKIPAKRQTVLT
jgi:signal transduction histidine kinase